MIEVLKPKILVELGTHSGNSFNAFCQAINKITINTECFAIDTWEGDDHAGLYSDNIYSTLSEYQKNNYSTFAHLMKMTFDDAVSEFSDGSIDLLHIDGLHTYEAVKHDFITWLPKLSRRGVVIFHDTTVKRDDFGVWKFWDEISPNYTSFNFTHGFGLGVLAVGSDIPEEFLTFLQQAKNEDFFQLLFEKIGSYIYKTQELNRTEKELLKALYELEMMRKSKVWIWGNKIKSIINFLLLKGRSKKIYYHKN